MKAIVKLSKLILPVLLICSQYALAFQRDNGDRLEKKKNYSKSYPLSSSEQITIQNRFGDVKINNWDKNEIKVEVTMSGYATTEAIAQEMLDLISIEDSKNSKGVNFKTVIGERKNKNNEKGYNNTGFSIDYEVYLPSHNSLFLQNEFGKTFLPDHSGELSLTQKFGVLKAGKLTNIKELSVEFSSGSTIEAAQGGKISIKFSRTEINRLSGAVNLSFEHCGDVKINVDNSISSIKIDNKFTTLNIDAAKDFNADYNIHTNFSELINKSSFTFKEDIDDDRRGPKFDHDYYGKSGTGSLRFVIRSEFGTVLIGHNISFDVNKKADEKKSGKRTRTL